MCIRDSSILMPAYLLAGASLALVCNLIARMPGFEGALPVNSVTALVGAPVVLSLIHIYSSIPWSDNLQPCSAKKS